MLVAESYFQLAARVPTQNSHQFQKIFSSSHDLSQVLVEDCDLPLMMIGLLDPNIGSGQQHLILSLSIPKKTFLSSGADGVELPNRPEAHPFATEDVQRRSNSTPGHQG